MSSGGADAASEGCIGTSFKATAIAKVHGGARCIHVVAAADKSHFDGLASEVDVRFLTDRIVVSLDAVMVASVGCSVVEGVIGHAGLDVEVRGVLAVIDGAVAVRVGFTLIGSTVAIAVL